MLAYPAADSEMVILLASMLIAVAGYLVLALQIRWARQEMRRYLSLSEHRRNALELARRSMPMPRTHVMASRLHRAHR